MRLATVSTQIPFRLRDFCLVTVFELRLYYWNLSFFDSWLFTENNQPITWNSRTLRDQLLTRYSSHKSLKKCFHTQWILLLAKCLMKTSKIYFNLPWKQANKTVVFITSVIQIHLYRYKACHVSLVQTLRIWFRRRFWFNFFSNDCFSLL